MYLHIELSEFHERGHIPVYTVVFSVGDEKYKLAANDLEADEVIEVVAAALKGKVGDVPYVRRELDAPPWYPEAR